jgi:hypothetical protein
LAAIGSKSIVIHHRGIADFHREDLSKFTSLRSQGINRTGELRSSCSNANAVPVHSFIHHRDRSSEHHPLAKVAESACHFSH